MAETKHRKTSEQKLQYWQAHNAACMKSGLTRTDYCTQNNLNVKTFAYWRHRLQAEAEPVKLVQVPRLGGQQSSPDVRLIVNGYAIEVLEGFNPSTLAAVVCVLRRL